MAKTSLVDVLPLLDVASKVYRPPRTRSFYAWLKKKCAGRDGSESLSSIVESKKCKEKSLDVRHMAADTVAEEPFWSRFVAVEVLGKGSFGTVYRARDTQTGSMVAVKQITANKKSREARNEAAMLQRVQHSSVVVRLHGFFDDCAETEDLNTKVSCIVMSLCEGGTLEEFVQENGPLDDDQLRVVAKEVVRLVQDCHGARVLHSDIKASNLMIASRASQEQLKRNPEELLPGWLVATDMGTARLAGMGFSVEPLGTPTHWAPEVFGRKYAHQADLWSSGTALFQLRFGRMPFWDGIQESRFRSTRDILQSIAVGRPCWEEVGGCDPLLKGFLCGLLEKDPSKRMTAKDAAVHQWLATTE